MGLAELASTTCCGCGGFCFVSVRARARARQQNGHKKGKFNFLNHELALIWRLQRLFIPTLPRARESLCATAIIAPSGIDHRQRQQLRLQQQQLKLDNSSWPPKGFVQRSAKTKPFATQQQQQQQQHFQ